MRRVVSFVLLLLVALTAGCGSGRVKARGRLLRDGQPLPADEPGVVHLVFIPLAEANPAAPEGSFVAEFHRSDATFRVTGRDGRGIPPGKYRIAVQVNRNRKDVFGGAFNAVNSPFVREVTSSGDEIVLDLEKPQG